MKWKEFLRQRWELIVAADFSSWKWTPRRLLRFVVLFFIELSTWTTSNQGIICGRLSDDIVVGSGDGARQLIERRRADRNREADRSFGREGQVTIPS